MPDETDSTLLLPDTLPEGHRSGFVAVVGRPNVGKSTLVNALLGQKIAIVSPRPQTTRDRLLGILTLPHAQVIFVDTPGIHQPLHKLGAIMVDQAAETIPDADLVLWVVDVHEPPADEDRQVADLVRQAEEVPALLVLNKTDLVQPDRAASQEQRFRDLAPHAEAIFVSAATGDHLPELQTRLIELLPLGPRYYPEEQVTDQHERFIAGEMVREAVLHHLHDEVPHAVAVAVNEFKERSEEMVYILATIYVERDTQKGIVVGKDGAMLKKIGQSARKGIEEMLERRVYLDLWVKVRPKWRSNEEELRRLGYRPPERR